MNTVNGSIALATAHKLRSAATALLADSEAQADPRLADSLMYEAGEIRARADSIEEQVKPPAIEEPAEFGSLVRAPWSGRQRLWVRMHKGYWEDETGIAAGWAELSDPEVLRIGVGDRKVEPLAEWESDLLNQQHRRGVAVSVLEAIDVDQYLIDAVRNVAPPDGFCVCPPDGRAKDCGIRRHRVEALT